METPRAIRKAAGEPQIQVAAQTKTSVATVRLYEANPASVGERRRSILDAHYARLRVRVTGEEEGPKAA